MKTYTITAEQLKDPLRDVKYPGVSEPGEYHYSESRNVFYPVAQQSYSDTEISSGLGIGGIGSDDYNIATEGGSAHYHSTHKCGGGQRYDEACASCGRVTVICNDCECCAKCHE